MNNDSELIQGSPRYLACVSQCRLTNYPDSGDETKGNCTCEKPSECYFRIKTNLEQHIMFKDVRKFWNEVIFER